MKRSLIAAVILTFYGLIALGQTASAPASINALRNAQKQVRWDDKSAVVADVTCDGLPDTLVVGYQPDKVWLGVVHGAKRNVTPTTETLSFSLGKSETSFCTSPVHIETAPIDCRSDEDDPLPGCKPVKGCREFSMVDGTCDSFHFYWDSTHKHLVWWRR